MFSRTNPRATRPSLVRCVFALLIAFATLLPVTAMAKDAAVPRKYAGIVLDAKSGKVLYESSADAARYPASVTKVMTLYVLFQELSAGNLTLQTKMKVSKHAAAAVPTKLGLKAGATITVENAIKSLVTLSANDMARVIAEHISGTESAFAKRMTATARALGMSRTTYRNASGLPDKGQVTTVRDQSVLGVAIYQHFPKYYSYFQTKSFSYGKRTYGNHNRLLGANGVDGIKTGYINASGFNLLTASRSDNRHVIVVAFGFNSGGARDAKVRELLKTHLPKARRGDYTRTAMIPVPGRKGATVMTASAQPVIPMPYPTWRTVGLAAAAPSADQPVAIVAASVGAPVPAILPRDIGIEPALQAANAMGASTASSAAGTERPLDVIGAWLSDTFSLGAAPAPLGQTRPSAPLLPPVGIGDQGEPIDLMTSGSVPAAPPAPAMDQQRPVLVAEASPAQLASAAAPVAPAEGWIVQVGAAPTEQGAKSLISDAATRINGLDAFRPLVERFEKNGQIFFRARFAGFAGRDDATGMCGELKRVKMSCLAMRS